jgi:hypothetical protein
MLSPEKEKEKCYYETPLPLLPRTTSPPSHEPTIHPSSTSAFRTAGLSTLTWFAECAPRPVIIFNGLSAGRFSS